MKVKKSIGTPTFTPVVVTITLETAEELKLAQAIFGADKTIGRAVSGNYYDGKQAAVEQFLLNIYGEVR